MKTILFISIVLLSCNVTTDHRADASYIAEHCRKCSPEQLKAVDEYFEICNKSSYYSSHCMDRAVVIMCDSIKCK